MLLTKLYVFLRVSFPQKLVQMSCYFLSWLERGEFWCSFAKNVHWDLHLVSWQKSDSCLIVIILSVSSGWPFFITFRQQLILLLSFAWQLRIFIGEQLCWIGPLRLTFSKLAKIRIMSHFYNTFRIFRANSGLKLRKISYCYLR